MARASRQARYARAPPGPTGSAAARRLPPPVSGAGQWPSEGCCTERYYWFELSVKRVPANHRLVAWDFAGAHLVGALLRARDRKMTSSTALLLRGASAPLSSPSSEVLGALLSKGQAAAGAADGAAPLSQRVSVPNKDKNASPASMVDTSEREQADASTTCPKLFTLETVLAKLQPYRTVQSQPLSCIILSLWIL